MDKKELQQKLIEQTNKNDKIYFSRLGKKRNLELINKIGGLIQGSKAELEELYEEVKEFNNTIRHKESGLDKGLTLSKEDYLKEELAFLKKHNLDDNPTYNELITAEAEIEHFIDYELISKMQADYLESEVSYLKSQRKQLQKDANHIKDMGSGGHPFETTGFVMHINQVIRSLNEKFNFSNLYLGGGRALE